MSERNPITVMHFPEKVTMEEFFELLFDEAEKNAFIKNMKNLGEPETKWAEDWAHQFLAWKEFNK